ncbi:MAG: hypothetical protein F6K35_18335 [Okeania sp. SIO2H7]|nr:hypothetical protein [Okeania sp. SIO2H7]
MSDFLQNLDLFELKLDLPTLRAIAELLDYTESLIDPSQEQEAIAYLYDLKNQIFQLKSQKDR